MRFLFNCHTLLCQFFIYQFFISYQIHIDASETKKQTITVIGAGLAGLTTAYELKKRGYSVEIYEARCRPGGRVCTAYFENTYEELGGKYIDDASNPSEILDLIQELGLQIKNTLSGDLHKKYKVSNREVIPFLHPFKEGPEPTEDLLNSLREKATQTQTLSDLMDFFFSKNPLIRHQMELTMRNYEGTETNKLTSQYLEISVWNFYKLFYEACHGNQVKRKFHKSVEGGNMHLILALAETLKEHIHYNFPLMKIRSYENKRMELHFNCGEPVLTDYLVLAIPCTTLREVDIEKHLIPDDQLLAIQTLQYGTNAKILLPIKISDEEATKSLHTDNMFSWLNHDHTIMTWYYGGSQGIFDVHSPKDLHKKIDEDIHALQLVYQDIEFPLGTTPSPIKEDSQVVYTQPIAVSWANEEFSKGSYSNHGIENDQLFREVCEDYEERILKVFRSIDDCIFFAGEHTDIEDFATMGGAVRSGKKAAKMLDRAVKSSFPKKFRMCLSCQSFPHS